MKNESFAGRKCSALLAAGAGAAVCLTGSEVLAVNGADGADIAAGSFASELGGKIALRNFSAGALLACVGANTTAVAVGGIGVLRTYAAGQQCSTAGPWAFSASVLPGAGGSGKYIAVRFSESATTKYGWLEFTRSGNNFIIGAWSYNNDGDGILTLSESVKTTKLALSDGRTGLHWTNTNEDGVARYEIQAKDDSGAWKAVDSSAPGEGSYSANVPKDATCRLIVEKIDGTTHEVGF